MDPIPTTERLVKNFHRSQFRRFEHSDQFTHGESYLQLDDAAEPGTGFHVYKMAPGAATVPHEHTGDEHFLVLEGELIDHDGYVYKAGDLVLLKRGTKHNSTTSTGCTLAVYISTAEIAVG